MGNEKKIGEGTFLADDGLILNFGPHAQGKAIRLINPEAVSGIPTNYSGEVMLMAADNDFGGVECICINGQKPTALKFVAWVKDTNSNKDPATNVRAAFEFDFAQFLPDASKWGTVDKPKGNLLAVSNWVDGKRRVVLIVDHEGNVHSEQMDSFMTLIEELQDRVTDLEARVEALEKPPEDI